MGEDVKRRRGGDHRRHGDGIERVDKAKGWFQQPGGNAGLGVHFLEVENGDAGGLTAGAGGGRNGEQRLGRAWNRGAFADRGVDIEKKVVGRIGGIEIRGFGRVDHRTASQGYK